MNVLCSIILLIVPVKHHIIVHNGVLAYTPTKLSGARRASGRSARNARGQTNGGLEQYRVKSVSIVPIKFTGQVDTLLW